MNDKDARALGGHVDVFRRCKPYKDAKPKLKDARVPLGSCSSLLCGLTVDARLGSAHPFQTTTPKTHFETFHECNARPSQGFFPTLGFNMSLKLPTGQQQRITTYAHSANVAAGAAARAPTCASS